MLDILSQVLGRRPDPAGDRELIRTGGTLLMTAYVDTGYRLRRVTLPLGTGFRARSALEAVIGGPPVVVVDEVDAVRSRLVDDLLFVTLNGTSARGTWSATIPRADVATFLYLMDLWNGGGPTSTPAADVHWPLAHLRPKTYLRQVGRVVFVATPAMMLTNSSWTAELPIVPRLSVYAVGIAVSAMVVGLPPGPIAQARNAPSEASGESETGRGSGG